MARYEFSFHPDGPTRPDVVFSISGTEDEDITLEGLVDMFTNFLQGLSYTNGSIRKFINSEMVE